MESAIQQLLATRPFVAFQIRLTNRDEYTISEPDLAEVESDATLAVFRRKAGVRERIAVVALDHVVSLDIDSDNRINIPY